MESFNRRKIERNDITMLTIQMTNKNGVYGSDTYVHIHINGNEVEICLK